MEKAKNKIMKKTAKFLVIILTLIIVLFPLRTSEIIFASIPFNEVLYTGEIKHFFTHELIYSPQRAFAKTNGLRYNFDRDHLTTSEFFNFLETMRKNNYILVDFNKIFDFGENSIKPKDLYIPFGKKPFTLSLDDMSYDTVGRGIISKLTVDEKGEIKDFTIDEEQQISNNRESITILEDYLKKYPDFSYKNSKMCICVNGYNGILGYRINENGKENTQEKNELMKVVNALKEKGYTFACHTYSHHKVSYVSAEEVMKDIQKWQDEIESIVGKTNVFCFPGGIHSATGYNDSLVRNKFSLLLCVGMDLNKKNEKTENYIYLYRIPLDGNSLRTYPNMYRDIFEPTEIYDNDARFISFREY